MKHFGSLPGFPIEFRQAAETFSFQDSGFSFQDYGLPGFHFGIHFFISDSEMKTWQLVILK